jgi:hypothetical protein
MFGMSQLYERLRFMRSVESLTDASEYGQTMIYKPAEIAWTAKISSIKQATDVVAPENLRE